MDYIKIKEEPHPFNLGMAALSEIEKITGQNTLLGVTFNNTLLVACLFCGLKHGARRENKKFDFTLDKCADIVDEQLDLLTDVIKLYRKQVLREDVEQGEAKAVS